MNSVDMNGVGPNLAITAVVTLAGVLATFAVARLRKRYDTVDTFWGLGFAIIALVTFASSDGSTTLRVVVTVLTVVWGVRLAVHLQLRNRKLPEDPRYVDIVQRAGDHPGLRIFVTVYLFQGVVLWFVSLPVQFAEYSSGFGVTAWLGVALWLAGFGFETVGDEQLRRFKAGRDNTGKVLDTGLWRYTRHPNYFGDACVWWGLYLLACSTWPGAATILTPLAMTYTLAKGTGKPLLEKGMRKSRPGYAYYVERTSGFFPLPPRKGVTPP
jgi:steroid 5-alpha reductase family enzyme